MFCKGGVSHLLGHVVCINAVLGLNRSIVREDITNIVSTRQRIIQILGINVRERGHWACSITALL